MRIYIHNKGDFGRFYGNTYNSKIKLLVNKNSLNTKTFDNMFWHSEVRDIDGNDVKDDTLSSAEYITDYQSSGLIILNLSAKTITRKERTWSMQVPRSVDNRERLRDKYLEVEYGYHNAFNHELKLHYFITSFRTSPRKY